MARSPHASYLHPRVVAPPPVVPVSVTVAPAPVPPVPCVHLGSPVRGPDAPDTVRDYRRCDHPDQPLGPVTCACRGCGPRCVGYSA